VQAAKLRLYATGGTAGGPAVSSTSPSWTEAGLTWTNRPAKGAPRDRKGKIVTGTWVEFDVTPFVTGNGAVAFVVSTEATDGLDANSREAAADRPELVVTTG
jgi:hypothetical protein